MITLKIKKAGYTIDIPGLPVCRTPVEINISKLDIRVVAMSLKTVGISEYEIITDVGKGIKEVYTKNDFEKEGKDSKEPLDSKNINKRFTKLEKMISMLLLQKDRNLNLEKEQITNKLNRLENIMSKQISFSLKKEVKQEPEVEELDSFIPDIDTSKMKIESKNLKSIKQESNDLDNTADILSSLIKKE